MNLFDLYFKEFSVNENDELNQKENNLNDIIKTKNNFKNKNNNNFENEIIINNEQLKDNKENKQISEIDDKDNKNNNKDNFNNKLNHIKNNENNYIDTEKELNNDDKINNNIKKRSLSKHKRNKDDNNNNFSNNYNIDLNDKRFNNNTNDYDQTNKVLIKKNNVELEYLKGIEENYNKNIRNNVNIGEEMVNKDSKDNDIINNYEKINDYDNITDNENKNDKKISLRKTIEIKDQNFDAYSLNKHFNNNNQKNSNFTNIGLFSLKNQKNNNKIIYMILHRKIIIHQNNHIDNFFFQDLTELINHKICEIEESNKKQKVFAKISHEFKTPLNSIIGKLKIEN